MIDLPVDRRTIIQGLLASVAASGLSLEKLAQDRTSLLRRTLEQVIGPFRMSDSDFARFESDYTKWKVAPKGVEIGLLNATNALGVTDAVAQASPALKRKLKFFERSLMTEFVLAVSIQERPGTRQVLTYNGLFGDGVCSNPFARFDQ